MIVFVKNSPKSTTKKHIMELISGHSKITGYKVTIQKSIDFLFTISEHLELEIKN